MSIDLKLQLQGTIQENLKKAVSLDGTDPASALYFYHEILKATKRLHIMNDKSQFLQQVEQKTLSRVQVLESSGYTPKSEQDSNIAFKRNTITQNAPGIQTNSIQPKASKSQIPPQRKSTPPPEPENATSQLSSAILKEKPDISFKDVAGLEVAKQALNESIIMPLKLPHLFDKATKPWRGILLYGPPGTGKSFIAKAVAGEAKETTFLTVTTAELTSKWVGESEKLIRDLFNTARAHKPSIIFLDEIDSLVSNRSDNESEHGRRLKTEFLIQMDGVSTNNDGVVLIGATNTPWDLDPAMRRRFEKRIYIPLPDEEARFVLIKNKLKDAHHSLSETGMRKLAKQLDGFSGADVSILIREACMIPIRELQKANYFKKGPAYDAEGNRRTDLWIACKKDDEGAVKAKWSELPPNEIGKPIISARYFKMCLETIKPSVSKQDLKRYIKWTEEFGEDGK